MNKIFIYIQTRYLNYEVVSIILKLSPAYKVTVCLFGRNYWWFEIYRYRLLSFLLGKTGLELLLTTFMKAITD